MRVMLGDRGSRMGFFGEDRGRRGYLNAPGQVSQDYACLFADLETELRVEADGLHGESARRSARGSGVGDGGSGDGARESLGPRGCRYQGGRHGFERERRGSP
jgi:hypothetical protein